MFTSFLTHAATMLIDAVRMAADTTTMDGRKPKKPGKPKKPPKKPGKPKP